MEPFTFNPIGYVRSPFKDKFGIPRQPGLVGEAKAVIKIANDPDLKTSLNRIAEFSHIWIIFVFHDHGGKKWKPSIRPPRLGGNAKVGVLSSRSPHRPNPIGISAVKLDQVDLEALGGPELHVTGIDLLDQTPVLDIKPYLPYADSIPEASSGWAHEEIKKYDVVFTVEALQDLDLISEPTRSELKQLATQVIELDPRPAFKKRQHPAETPETWGQRYGLDVLGFDVKYMINQGKFHILHILNSNDITKK